MLSRKRGTQLLFSLMLGLAFFGCVGLPRRRPPTEIPRRESLEDQAGAELRIPSESSSEAQPVAQASSRPVPPPPPAHLVEAPQTPPASPMPPPEQVNPPPAQPEPPMQMRLVNRAEPPSPAEDDLAAIKALHQKAAQQYAGIDSYIVRLTRRETVKGKHGPEETLLFKFRKEPWSLYFKWLGSKGKGREVVFVKGRHEGKIHTLLAAGDVPLMAAGKRMALAPENVLVRSNTRHCITEAGVGALIEQIGCQLEAQEKGDNGKGKMSRLGSTQRPEFAAPVEGIAWEIPPRGEEALPKGGKRWCFFDPENHLPVLIITHDDRDKEVEYYRYDRFQFPVKLDDKDFDPDTLWPKK